MGFISDILGLGEKESENKVEKLWEIGDHRVSETVIKESQDIGQSPFVNDVEYRGYKCVDCEKESVHRGKFKEMDCYSVIEEEP